MENLVLAGTGHRPKKLGLDYSEVCNRVLREFLTLKLKELDEERGVALVLSGVALGFDLALAEAAVRVGIPFVAVLPFLGVQDTWPKKSQNRFDKVLSQANRLVVTSDGGWSNEKYLIRDRYLVDESQLLLALFDEKQSASGTGATVRYAHQKQRMVVNFWNSWVAFRNKRVQ